MLVYQREVQSDYIVSNHQHPSGLRSLAMKSYSYHFVVVLRDWTSGLFLSYSNLQLLKKVINSNTIIISWGTIEFLQITATSKKISIFCGALY
jgi:hypothetical protein